VPMTITSKAPKINIHKDPCRAVALLVMGAAAGVSAVSDDVLPATSGVVGATAGVLSASEDVLAATAGVVTAAAGVARSLREGAGSRDE
jgi:hypothetical protein